MKRHRTTMRNERLGSFPFVSGDSFALACQRFPFGRPFRSSAAVDDATPDIWFVEVSDLEEPLRRDSLLGRAARSEGRPTLVLHNGDLIPPPEFFDAALEVFERVFSVNLVEERERLRAIPIGLENCWHRGPGELMEYVSAARSLGRPDEELGGRDRLFFAAHRVATNPVVRGHLSRLLSARGIANRSTSRSEYRAALRRSLFVLSPPGNGPDCHRTWEAVYSGAVPVVLRAAIAPGVVEGAPVVVVDEWEEMLDLSTDELRRRYVECVGGQTPGATFMPRWLDEIGRLRADRR